MTNERGKSFEILSKMIAASAGCGGSAAASGAEPDHSLHSGSCAALATG